jgi:hypothetical protein
MDRSKTLVLTSFAHQPSTISKLPNDGRKSLMGWYEYAPDFDRMVSTSVACSHDYGGKSTRSPTSMVGISKCFEISRRLEVLDLRQQLEDLVLSVEDSPESPLRLHCRSLCIMFVTSELTGFTAHALRGTAINRCSLRHCHKCRGLAYCMFKHNRGRVLIDC